MTRKKKKIKLPSSKKKRRTPIFIRFAFPVGMGSGQPGPDNAFLIEAKHFQKGLDVLHNKVMPDQSKKSLDHVAFNIRDATRAGTINAQSWLSLILMAETLGFTPGKMFAFLGKYNSSREVQKLRVAFLNQLKVKQLLRKINKWGKTPKAWRDHRKYIDAWCKQTGTPLFNSLSNFEDYVTAWREATVGKRNKIRVLQTALGTGSDREFSIFNKPPK